MDDNVCMKILLLMMVILFMGCQEKYQLPSTEYSINSASISGGNIVIAGTNLTLVQSAEPTSANLSGYKMEVVSKSPTSLSLKLTHTSSSALNLAFGTVLTFIISTAHADTAVTLTVDVAPTGAVMAFNLASCPAGWSAMDGNAGRPDARGRTIVGSGQGAGLTNRALASVGGAESHVLTIAQMPTHTHATEVNADGADTSDPTLAYLGPSPADSYSFLPSAPGAPVSAAGGSQPHSLMNPYLVLTYCQKN